MPLKFLAWNSPLLDFSRIPVTVTLINIMLIITIRKTYLIKDPLVTLLYMENTWSILTF